MPGVLTYSIIVFFWWYVICQSDLLARPRGWARKVLPRWITYVGSCPLCWTFWAGVLLTVITMFETGFLILVSNVLFVAPVINLIIGLIVSALKRLNEPTHL